MDIKWVRAIISLLGIMGISYGALIAKLISPDAYITIITATIIWWYKSRDEEKKG